MKKTRHTEEQIAFTLKQAETDMSVAQVIRRRGSSASGAGPGERLAVTVTPGRLLDHMPHLIQGRDPVR